MANGSKDAPVAIHFLLAWTLLATAAAVLGGCGGGNEQGPQRPVDRSEQPMPGPEQQTVSDGTGDVRPPVRVTNPPRLSSLDLRRVTLRRDADRLRVRFTTVQPPEPGVKHVLLTYDSNLRQEGAVEVRHQRDGSVRAVAIPPDGTSRPIKASVRGAEVVAEAPLNRFTRAGTFNWRAFTEVTLAGGEITDRVPSRITDYLFFPRSP